MLYNIASTVISGLPVADNNSISNNKLNTRNISIYRRVCVCMKLTERVYHVLPISKKGGIRIVTMKEGKK